jgi:hypothetical protein
MSMLPDGERALRREEGTHSIPQDSDPYLVSLVKQNKEARNDAPTENINIVVDEMQGTCDVRRRAHLLNTRN